MFLSVAISLLVFSSYHSHAFRPGISKSLRLPRQFVINTDEAPITTQGDVKLSLISTARNVFAAVAIMGMVGSKAAKAEESADGYVTTESGLKYLDVKVGTGPVPTPGQIVRVHYTGWLDGIDGEKKFDSSYDRRSPLSFPVGARRVIAGWDEGILTDLKVGGKRNLVIPPELGYGSRGAGGVIPPGATLYFTVELVGIGAK